MVFLFDAQILCEVGGADLIFVSCDRLQAWAGEAIRLKPDLARAHRFDTEIGRSLWH